MVKYLQNLHVGQLAEFPQFQIDLFSQESIDWGETFAFLLTHAHSDHTHGIFEYFLEELYEKDPKYVFYMHQLTYEQLHFWNQHYYENDRKDQEEFTKDEQLLNNLVLQGKIKFLKKHRKYTFVFENCKILLTPLSAGHHPGSLMFLFEKFAPEPLYTVLYTGDCRVNLKDLEYCRSLRVPESKGYEQKYKKIDLLYIDTTFGLNEENPEFISRRKATDNILNAIMFREIRSVDILMAGYVTQIYLIQRIFNITEDPITVSQAVHDCCEKIDDLRGKTVPVLNINLEENDRNIIRFVTKHFHTANQNIIKLMACHDWPFYLEDVENSELKYSPPYLNQEGYYYPGDYSMHLSRNDLLRTIDFLKPKACKALILPKIKGKKRKNDLTKNDLTDKDKQNISKIETLMNSEFEAPQLSGEPNEFPSFVFDFTGMNEWNINYGEETFNHT